MWKHYVNIIIFNNEHNDNMWKNINVHVKMHEQILSIVV